MSVSPDKPIELLLPTVPVGIDVPKYCIYVRKMSKSFVLYYAALLSHWGGIRSFLRCAPLRGVCFIILNTVERNIYACGQYL